jgi:predicted ABC-type ATPase
MVSGPNGSGKTTLTRQLRRDGVDFGLYINPDDIALDLEDSYDDRVRRAQAIADQQRAEALDRGESFSFETVMSHPSKIELLRKAKQAGFRTVLFFVATESPDLNVERVRQRVALGGHDVPEDRIRGRYSRTLGLLPAAIALADDVVLFDNSHGRPSIIRPFLRKSEGRTTIAPPVPDWAKRAIKAWLPLSDT